MTAKPPGGRQVIFVLGAISALGSMAIHIMVPALPMIAGDLQITPHGAQKVISIYLFGLAGGQLLAGPLIDRIGRKPVLMAGLLLYALAAVGAALARSIDLLVAARALQAVGGATGVVTARVLVGDLFDKAEGGRRQASLMGIVLLSPAIAPVIGGFVSAHFGWRPVLALQAAIALPTLLAAFRLLPDGAPRSSAGARPKFFQSYGKLVRNARFLRATCAFAGSSCALYMFLGVAPFLLIERWGLTSDEAGLCFLLVAGAAILGTFAVGWIEQRMDALRVGLSFGLTGACLALVLALAGIEHWTTLIGPVLLMTIGAGITGPSGIAIVVHSEPGLSGTATSLSGAMQMALAGTAAVTIGWVGQPDPVLLGIGMVACTLTAFALAPRTPARRDS